MFDQAIHNLQSWSGVVLLPGTIVLCVVVVGFMLAQNPTTMFGVWFLSIIATVLLILGVLTPFVIPSPSFLPKPYWFLTPSAPAAMDAAASAGAARATPLSREAQVKEAQTRWAK